MNSVLHRILGIFLASSDIVVTGQLEEQIRAGSLFGRDGNAFSLLAHRVNLATGKEHGIYSIVDDKPSESTALGNYQCAFVLQKPSIEKMRASEDVVQVDAKWLNLIWLNFGFHNAHHERPIAPWYKLPALHRDLYPEGSAQVITVGELLRSFHFNRVKRILASDYGEVQPPGVPHRADRFVGAVGVSFLTAV